MAIPRSPLRLLRWLLAAALLAAWAFGIASGHVAGGYLHVLPAVALLVLVVPPLYRLMIQD